MRHDNLMKTATREDGTQFEVHVHAVEYGIDHCRVHILESTLKQLEEEKATIQFTHGYVQRPVTRMCHVPV